MKHDDSILHVTRLTQKTKFFISLALFAVLAFLLTYAQAHSPKYKGQPVQHEHKTVEGHQHGKYSVDLGVGRDGAGMLEVSSLHKDDRIKLLGRITSDENDSCNPGVRQIRRTKPGDNFLPLQDDCEQTGTISAALAYRWYPKRLVLGLGGAIVADDDTENFSEHVQAYAEAGVRTPKRWWLVDQCGFSFMFGSGGGEGFFSCGKEI